ncbi:MAG: hypothetical protein ACEQSA_03805 [Weeksellaceae bacterium]
MSKKHFYSHIIDIETIHISLDELELDPDDKKELVEIVETTVHHVVLDTVLSELPKEHKKTFLKHLAEEKHEDLWKLVKEHVSDAEDQIHKAVQKVKHELHADIREAKTK